MKRRVWVIVLVAAIVLPNLAGSASAASQSQADQAVQDGLAWLAGE